MNGEYAKIAHEYYDAELHPTCSNFSVADSLLLEAFWEHIVQARSICEVGAGRSGLLEFAGKALGSILVTDKSGEMLEHSRNAFGENNYYVVSDAIHLPVLSASVDLVVSLLGDPYNVPDFWREASRIIRPGGRLLFTTPSWEWANAFREGNERESGDSALFILANGDEVYVPSHILSKSRQIELAESFDFFLIMNHDVSHEQISLVSENLSRKIEGYLDRNVPVVTGYIFERT